jgi:chromosome segregation ATPase
MIFKSVQSKAKTSEKIQSLRPAKPPTGRERLQHFDDNIGLAEKAIADLENRIERLESIVVDAVAAAKDLQAAVEADNGKSLADYSAGKVEADSNIAKLVMASDNSGRAATAAKAALPSGQAQLENARAQLVSLTEQRAAELQHVLAILGDTEARAYQKLFDDLGRAHDRLVGYAQVCESNLGDVRLIIDPVKAPRFGLPSMGNADADPFLRHRESELTIAESARASGNIRDRLAADAQADLSDLLF